MKRFFGVDCHKAFSYGTIMGEAGEILKQGRFGNQPEAEARVKTDKIDATTLAHLLRCDLIPRAHVSSPAVRVVKNLLRHRMFLVRVQTMTKNRIHVLLDRHPGVRSCRPVVELFTNPGLAWLKSIDLPEPDRWILDNELALLVSEIDAIDRFRSAAKLHAYAGLIPSTYASGGKTFHGRIVKQGNKYIRWAMVEAVWPAIRKDAALRRYYERLARRKDPISVGLGSV